MMGLIETLVFFFIKKLRAMRCYAEVHVKICTSQSHNYTCFTLAKFSFIYKSQIQMKIGVSCWLFLFASALISNTVTAQIAETSDHYALRVAFLAPDGHDSEIELNRRVENIFRGRVHVQHGWYVEANREHTFHLYLIEDRSGDEVVAKLSSTAGAAATKIVRKFRRMAYEDFFYEHQFYVYFTSNPDSCDDFLEHTHTPILVQPHHHRRWGLFKAHGSFSLEYSDQPYFMCLSDPFLSENYHRVLIGI